MLKCIAIDDEPAALELMEDYILRIPYLQLEGCFDDPVKAMHFIGNGTVDLVFLDIQMPALTGLQLIRSLSKKPMFILVTAYDQFALEAFYDNAVDYLLKPVPFERFVKATNRANELYQLKKGGVSKNQTDHLFIYTDGTYLKIMYDDILWIEAQKDYLKIFTASSSQPIVTRMSLKSMEDQLPGEQFIRIQKSFIASRERISAVKRSSVIVGGKELPVGELYKDALQQIVERRSE